jgi:hypothetical protein
VLVALDVLAIALVLQELVGHVLLLLPEGTRQSAGFAY